MGGLKIRRRSAARTILRDWTYRSRTRASALWMRTRPRPKRVAEEVELVREIPASVIVLAIDDFRLVRMQRQSAFCEPRFKSRQYGLRLTTTMADRIVGTPFTQSLNQDRPIAHAFVVRPHTKSAHYTNCCFATLRFDLAS